LASEWSAWQAVGEMPSAPPRKYYIVTIRGERGPVDRAEMKDLVRDGEALLADQVRTATGRPIGTVAEVLAQVRVRDTGEHQAIRVPDENAQPAQRSSGSRNPRGVSAGNAQQKLWLAITGLAAVAVVALIAVAWAVGRSTAPPVVVPVPVSAAPNDTPPTPAPVANPVAAYDSPLHPVPGPAADAPPHADAVGAGGGGDPVPAPPTRSDPASLPLSVVRDVMLWNGEACAGGHGWCWPTNPPNSIDIQDKIAHSGRYALCFHGEGTDTINAGWQWDTTTTTVAFTKLHAVVVSMKIVGTALPTSVLLVLEGDGKQSRYAGLMDFCPDLADGQWHDIAVPFSALVDANADAAIFNQVQINAIAKGALHFDIYVDDIGYAQDEPGKH